MWDGFNLRKFPRINVRCHIQVYLPRSRYAYSTMTQNMGVGGICVYLEKSFKRFTSCRVKIRVDRNSEPMECEAQIVWSVPTRKKNESRKRCYDTGIEFLNTPVEMVEKLNRFIQKEM